MPNANARLLVLIEAATATFREEMTRATKLAESSSKQISSAIGTIQHSLEAVGVAVSAHAFVSLIDNTIKAQGHLVNLSESTGVAVETLGGIGYAAKSAGSDLDSVAKVFGKFNIEIAKASAGDEQALDAFNKLGISLAELRKNSPEETFARVADSFNKYADGPQKAAIANALFKKNFQEIVPLLNQGGAAIREAVAYYQKYSGVTEETAQRSKEFTDTLEKLQLLNGAFANNLAANLLPSLQAVANLYVDAKEKGDGFAGTSERIAESLKIITKIGATVAFFFYDLGDALGALGARAVALSKLNLRAFQEIGEERRRQEAETRKQYDKVLEAIDGKGGDSGNGPRKPKAPAPDLLSSGAQEVAKKQFEQALKALDLYIAAEEQALKGREHFLQAYYQDEYIGVREFFAAREESQNEALANQRRALDEELSIATARAAKSGPKDRVDAETKIIEITARRTKLDEEAALKGSDLWFEQNRALKAYRESIEALSIQLAQLNGDSVLAGVASFDKQYEEFRKKSEAAQRSPNQQDQREGAIALRQLASLRERTIQQLQLNDAQAKFGTLTEAVSIAQSRIDLQQSTGEITTIEAMNKKADLARSYIDLLNSQAAAYENVARALPPGQAQDDAINKAARLRLEIDQLAASADALKDKFRGIFTDAFSDELANVVTGTKTVAQAFRDMERTIVASISRIASQNIAEAIFGKSGTFGGLGSFFASLFGAGSGGSSGIPAGAFIPPGGGLADGTDYARGGLTLVGERGPELVMMPRGAQVIPNDRLVAARGARATSSSINIAINVPGNVSTATANQIAAKTGAAVQRALMRNG